MLPELETCNNTTSAKDFSLLTKPIQEVNISSDWLFLSAGILIWDILSHALDDCRMFTEGPLKAPLVVYLVSRVSSLGLLVTNLFLSPVAMDINCHIGSITIDFLFFLTLSSNHALFYLRARAIYLDNRLVRTILLTLWLATVGSCSAVFFVFKAVPSPIKGLSSCIVTGGTFSIGLVIVIMALVHDTAVFMSISYRVYQFVGLDEYCKGRMFRLLIPAPINTLSLWRCILQDGQLFYLISLFWEILITTLMIVPSLDPYYRVFMIPVYVAIVNSMACRVFRNVRLGKFREQTLSRGDHQVNPVVVFAQNNSLDQVSDI